MGGAAESRPQLGWPGEGDAMTTIWPILGSGFVLGWSVAWPPGPISAEMVRRCLAGGFWAGFSLNFGACTGDAFWAVLVALGVGLLFTTPGAQLVLGLVSLGLLAGLVFGFTKSAVRAWRGQVAAAVRFDGARAGFALGLSLALASPWNVTFWLAALGRPGVVDSGVAGLFMLVLGVVLGASSWGLILSLSATFLRGRFSAAAGRWAAVGMNAATAALMLWFAVQSARRLYGV